MTFFNGFLNAPPTCQVTATLILVQMKGVDVVHIWAKFHVHVTYNS